MPDIEVVIFEDQRQKIMRAPFQKEFKKAKTLFSFFEPVKDSTLEESKKPFDLRLKNEICTTYPNLKLIVCDSDLSGTSGYMGLSEVVVSKTASDLAIPLCSYAVGESYRESSENLRRWADFKIIVDSSPGGEAKLALECRIIFQGFQELMEKYPSVVKSAGGRRPPAEILAKILGRSNLADKIALYGAGDKQMLAEILPFATKAGGQIESKRMVRLLGYWLWNSLLKFPGVLLNEIAAASYLNIDPNDFKKADVQKLFKKAVYTGPFAEIRAFWWRDILNEILFEQSCEDGFALAQKKKIAKIKHCKCSVDPKQKAGYYCMLTEKPVSADKSRSNISWFPAGADLARISTPMFDELEPWLGLY